MACLDQHINENCIRIFHSISHSTSKHGWRNRIKQKIHFFLSGGQ